MLRVRQNANVGTTNMRTIGRNRAMMMARNKADTKGGAVYCCVCKVRSSSRGLF